MEKELYRTGSAWCICEECCREWDIERKCIFYNIRDICEICGKEDEPVMDEEFWYQQMEAILLNIKL